MFGVQASAYRRRGLQIQILQKETVDLRQHFSIYRKIPDVEKVAFKTKQKHFIVNPGDCARKKTSQLYCSCLL